jgi:hypothetical protein
MASTNTRPDQSFSEAVVSTCSADGKLGIDFGFDANQLVLLNDKATDVYVSLDSTVGSTDGYRLKAAETLSLSNVKVGRMSLASTSTSTGDNVRVGAWAW